MVDRSGRSRYGGGVPLPYRRPADAAPVPPDTMSLIAALAQRGRQMQQQRLVGNTPAPQSVPLGSGGAPLTPPPNQTAPQYVSRPDLRIRGVAGDPGLQTRQYAAPRPPAAPVPAPPPPGLPPPVDSNGVPYPNWDQLTYDQKVNIYERMGLPIPEPVPSTFERNASQYYGSNNQTLTQPPIPMPQPDLSGAEGMADFAYHQPPPGWLEANDNDLSRWTSLSQTGKERQWDIYSNIAYAESNATAPPAPLPSSADVIGMTGFSDATTKRKADLLAADPYGPAGDYVPGTSGTTQMHDLFGRIIDTKQSLYGPSATQSDFTSYGPGQSLPVSTVPTIDLTELGAAGSPPVWTQVPPNWTGTAEEYVALPNENKAGLWQSYIQETGKMDIFALIDEVLPDEAKAPAVWALKQVDRAAGEVRSETGQMAYYMATNDGQLPPDSFGEGSSWVGSISDVAGPVVDLLSREIDPLNGEWGTTRNEGVVAIVMAEFLQQNPEYLPQIKSIYERAISLGASEDEAGQIVWDWFYSQQPFLTRLAAEGLWDPLILADAAGAAGTAITRKALKDAAEEAATGGITKTTAVRIGLGDVLTAPRRGAEAVQETVTRTATELADLVPGIKWARSKSPETIAKETAQQVDEAGDITTRTFDTGGFTGDAETDFRIAKQQSADAQIARDRDAQAKADAKKAEQQQAQAEKDEARRAEAEERKAQAELQKQIAAANKAEEARVRAQQKADEAQMRADQDAARRAEAQARKAEQDAAAAQAKVARAQADLKARHDAEIDRLQNWYTMRKSRTGTVTPADERAMQRRLDTIAARQNLTPDERNLIETVIRGDTTVSPSPTSTQAVLQDEVPAPTRIDPLDYANEQNLTAQRRAADVVTPTRSADAFLDDPARISGAPDEVMPYIDRSPLLREVVQRGMDDPEAARAFWQTHVGAGNDLDDIVEFAARDDALRAGVTSGAKETPERVFRAVSHHARLERSFDEAFGGLPEAGYTFRRDKGMTVGPNGEIRFSNEAAAIERAVYGSADESAAAFDYLLNRVSNGTAQFVNSRRIDQLAQMRNRVRGGATIGRPTPTVTSSTPEPTPANVVRTRNGDPVPAREQAIADRIQRHLDDNPDQVALGTRIPDVPAKYNTALFADTSSARKARSNLYKNNDPLADWISRKRAELYGDTSQGTKDRLGIVNDPRAQAGEMFETTNQVAEYLFGPLKKRAERRLGLTPDAPPPVDVDVNTWVGRARLNGNITTKDWDTLNVRATIPTKKAQPSKGILAEEKEYTFLDRFEENFRVKAEKARKDAGIDGLIARAKKGQEVTDAEFDAALARLSESIDGLVDEAVTQTNTEFRRAILGADAPARTAAGKGIKQAGNAISKVQNAQRANIMFSIVGGPRGYAQDMIDGLKRAIQFGEAGTARNVWKIQRRLMKWADETGVDPEVAMGLDSYARTGRKIPREYISGSSARLQMEGGQRIWTEGLRKYNPLKLVAVPSLKRLRTTGDSAWRIAMHDNIYTRGLVEGRGAFMQRVRQYATKIGDQSLVGDMAELGPYFSPEDVRRILDAHEITDMRLARSWAEQTDLAWKSAKDKVDTVYFDYKKTNADEQLSKIFMFHYFMTRYAGQQAGFLLTHPGFANAYANWWENKGELQSAIMPDWMREWVQWSLGNGMYAAANFDDFLFGFMGFATAGEGGFFDETTFDKIMRNSNLFPQPALQAAASAFGFSKKPTDVTGTGRLRNFITGLVNEARNTDAEWVPDFIKETGITEDKWRSMEARFVNYLSGLAEDATGGFVEGNQLRQDIDAKRENVERFLVANFEEEYGPKYAEDGETVLWDQATLDEYQAAEDALDAGDYTNPHVEKAIDDWAATGFANEVAKTVAPFQAGVRSTAVDTDTAETSAFYEGESEDQSAAAMTSWRNLNSPEARAIVGGNEQYKALGTEDEQWVLGGVNQIISGEIPEGQFATIGGEYYSAAEVNAMSFDERMDLAMQWLDDIEADGSVPNANALYESIKGQQAAFRAAHPEFDDFKKYQRWVNGETDADALANLKWLEGQGGTEFARAASEKRAELQSQGLSPDEIDERMLGWLNTGEAYLAVMGYIYKGDSALPAVDTTSVPAWRQEESSGGGSGSSKTFQTDEKPLSLAETLGPDRKPRHQFNNDYVLKAWADDLQAARMSPDQIEQQLSLGLMKPETLKTMARNGQIDRQQVLNWVRDGTLLRFDLYGMAEVEGVPAGDIRFLVEDGYLALDDVLDLIFMPTDARINRLRRLNQDRKYTRENQPDTSSGYGSNGFLKDYLFKP